MDLDCPICRSNYDLKKHIPLVLCTQHHLCCQQCVNQLFQNTGRKNCPQCRQELIRSKIIKFRLFSLCEQKIQMQREQLQKQKQQYDRKQSQILNEYREIIKDLIVLNNDQDRKYYQVIKEKAINLIQAKQYHTAIILLQNLIEKYPNQPSFIGIGCKEQEKGYSQNCNLNWYKQHYRVDRFDAEDILAFVYLRNSQYQNQRKWYQKMIDWDPSNYKLLFGLAITQHNSSNTDKALQIYQQIIQINPLFPKAYELSAFIQMQKQNRQKSVYYSTKCLQLQPNNIFAQYLLIDQKQNEEQIWNRISRIIQLQPQYVRAYNWHGNYLFNHGQYEDSIQKYAQCLSINSQYIDPIINIAYCYIQLDQYKQASKTLYQLYNRLTQTYQNYSYFYDVGLAYKRMKKYSIACEWLNKCVRVNPQNKNAHHELGQIYIKLKMHKQAIGIYKDIVVSQKTPEVYSKIVQIYSKDKDCSNAIIWLSKWLQIEPDNIRIHEQLADSYYRIDNLKESLKYCKNCLNQKHQIKKFYPITIQILRRQNRLEETSKQIKLYIKECELQWEELERMTKLGSKIDIICKKQRKNSEREKKSTYQSN